MDIQDKNIDGGKAFDWGRVSAEYAKFRDIYPAEFYESILARGIGHAGQKILDIGTGTGVLPRNMSRFGAEWVGTDISPEQIEAARRLSQGMAIEYAVSPTEELDFPDGSFDAVTACQCFWYFQHEKIAPLLHRLLKRDGKFLVLCMEWLPYEDKIAEMSEQLVLKYSPAWSGAGAVMQPIAVPECYGEFFDTVSHAEKRIKVRFTREGWNGRMKACRGIGASLSEEEVRRWEAEHMRLLAEAAPEEFFVEHYMAIVELRGR